jgi:uncharacterized iron-regulated membrane protein
VIAVRAALRRLHRWCGLLVAVFLMACGLTGSLIAFEHELDAALNPELFRTGNQQAALPLDALVAVIEARDPRIRVTQVPLDTERGHASEVHVQAREGPDGNKTSIGFDRLFVDPSSGRVLGARQWGAWRWDRAHLMPWVNRFHRTLSLPGRVGNQLLGTVAILWLFLSLSGLVLTLPARWASFWRQWKSAWQVKPHTKGLRFINDLHRAVGLWVLPLALCTAFTGVYLNLGNEVFKPLVRLFGPVSPHPVATLAQLPSPHPRESVLTHEQAMDIARALLPGGARDYVPWYIGHLPQRGAYRVAFKEPRMREEALRVRYEQVFVHDQTGQLLGRFGYRSGTATDRFLVWMYPIHSGKSWGLPGRLAIGLFGLLVAVLGITGVLRWTKRQDTRRKSV